MKNRIKTVHSYVHQGRIGALVEVSCVTDFAAKTEVFTGFCDDLCMQVTAMAPNDVPALLQQEWIKAENLTTATMVDRTSEELDEAIVIERFFYLDSNASILANDELPATPEQAQEWGEDILQVQRGNLTIDVGWYPRETYPNGCFGCVVVDHTKDHFKPGGWGCPYESMETRDPLRVQRWLLGFGIDAKIYEKGD